MSAPYDGYGQQPPADAAYAGQQQEGFEQAAPPNVPTSAPDHGKKKKRGYAAQAFDFGAGANSATAPQPAVGAQPYGTYPQPQTPAYPAAYPGQDPQPIAPTYGAAPAAAPLHGTPQTQGQAYGYQAPDATYPAPIAGGVPGTGTPGVASLNQQMAGMTLGPGSQPQPPQPGQAARPAALNQLYPVDLLNQPFNVSELDLPPPPIILPPNVRCDLSRFRCWSTHG